MATNLSIGSGSGTIKEDLDESYDFTPTANRNGSVTFDFDASDGGVVVHNSANLVVSPDNDAPVAGGTKVSATEESPCSGNLIVAGDIDGDTLM